MGSFNSNNRPDHSNRTHQQAPNNQATYIPGRPSPKYIRSILVQNKSSRTVTIETVHKSQQVGRTIIAPKTTEKIEKQVAKDGYVVVDAITRIMAKMDGIQGFVMQTDDSDATSIQARHYVVADNLSVTRLK